LFVAALFHLFRLICHYKRTLSCVCPVVVQYFTVYLFVTCFECFPRIEIGKLFCFVFLSIVLCCFPWLLVSGNAPKTLCVPFNIKKYFLEKVQRTSQRKKGTRWRPFFFFFGREKNANHPIFSERHIYIYIYIYMHYIHLSNPKINTHAKLHTLNTIYCPSSARFPSSQAPIIPIRSPKAEPTIYSSK